VRNERHKFSYFYAGGFEELFDLADDPHETRNLLAQGAGSAEIANIHADLKARLAAWEKQWGYEQYVHDSFVTQYNGRFIKLQPLDHEPFRNGQFPRFPSQITVPEEKAAMNDFGQEVIDAVKDEPLVKLSELDLKQWEINGAPKGTIGRIRKEGL